MVIMIRENALNVTELVQLVLVQTVTNVNLVTKVIIYMDHHVSKNAQMDYMEKIPIENVWLVIPHVTLVMEKEEIIVKAVKQEDSYMIQFV